MSTPCQPTPDIPLPPTATPPPNHLVWGILVTILCCIPGGIVAIVKSSQVNNLWNAGQYDAARTASESAKQWCIWSAVAGVVGNVLYVMLSTQS